MASSNNLEVVALFFAKQKREISSWNDILETANKLFTDHFQASDSPESLPARYLDNAGSEDDHRVAEVRFQTLSTPDLKKCKVFTDSVEIEKFQAKYDLQVILQPASLYATHKMPGLAIFDMDSTLIQQEVIDELARTVGLYDKVAAITEAAMRGEAPYTDFEASLRARVALLKGVPDSVWEKLKKDSITFTPGARDLIRTLKSLGWKTAVLSGGFTPLAYWVKDTLGLDYAHANQLVSDPALESLTGELVQEAPIIHGDMKRQLLLQLAAENNIAIENVIAVGDGSNDLPMMGAAGLGIAFNAKPKVQLAAPAKLNWPTLLDVMHVLGYSSGEIQQATASAV